MQTRALAGSPVSAIGLGAMGMSLSGRPSRERALATIAAALQAGITLIDTADAYALDAADVGHNERLVAEALAAWPVDPDRVMVATKGGHTRDDDGGWDVDGRPEYLHRACDASLRALGTDVIDLYQHHRPDPKVPFAESVGALRELQEAGKIRLVGLSNVTVGQIRDAQGIVQVASVQNQFSPAFTSSAEELSYCAEQGIAFLPWSPLGGIGNAADLAGRHDAFAGVGRAHGVSAQQVALAWELSLAPVVIPIPGASRPETIRDSAGAAHLTLSEEDLARLNELS